MTQLPPPPPPVPPSPPSPGAPAHRGPRAAHPEQASATASIVLGVCAIVLTPLFGLGIVLGILAIVFGMLARRAAPHGLATAGIITGVIGVVLSAGWWAIVVASGVFSTS
jgi:hypothetical protein